MRVVLKPCVRERLGPDLVVIFDPREALTLVDPDGRLEVLLDELSVGPRTVPEIAAALAARGRPATGLEIQSALTGLDSLGLVEDGDGRDLPDPAAAARHFSNLVFFGGYAGLHRPRAEFVRRLRAAHVLVLGVGGGGSSLLMCLTGLGIGKLTLVDRDDLEPRNFARQFVYRHADLGRSKVERAAEWVREFDPTVEVRPVDRWISGPGDLADLVDGVDLVAGGLDGHPDAALWVNEAAVRAGVPLVTGGMTMSQLVYYSVDPGRSRCRQCDERGAPDPAAASAAAIGRRRFRELRITNGLIGPLAMQIGSLVGYEALRYLTGFEPPRAAGAYVKLDLRTGLTPEREPFADHPDCPVCPLAPAGAGGRRDAQVVAP
jgi:molybdopterin/thiamine biosynthesis adenylyltransferase